MNSFLCERAIKAFSYNARNYIKHGIMRDRLSFNYGDGGEDGGADTNVEQAEQRSYFYENGSLIRGYWRCAYLRARSGGHPPDDRELQMT